VSIKFHADIIDGRVVTSVMNEGGPRDSARSKGSDDHDDDHEDDDHDKEHDDDHESGEHDDD